MEVIFVAGVHGVGKGVVTTFLAQRFNLPNYSASTLISSEKHAATDINKIVLNPESNQDLLFSGLDKLAPFPSPILLDGHFCLNQKDGIFNVDVEVFKQLNLKAIILLTAEADVIEFRLRERDGTSLEVSKIAELQSAEVAQAEFVANTLSIPLIIGSSVNTIQIGKLIEKLFPNK